jgi:hypothetical protein
LILAAPVNLDSKDLLVEEALNQLLKIMKFLEHIRFILKKVKPSKLAMIIDE